MATLTAASTQTAGLPYPPSTTIDQDPVSGDMYAMARTAASTVTFYRSTDHGGSWSSWAVVSRANLYDIGEMRVDAAGVNIHWSYLVSETLNSVTQDRLVYRRIGGVGTATSTVGGDVFVANSPNGGTPGSIFYTTGIFPYRNPDATYAIVVAATFHGPNSGLNLYGVSITADYSQTYVNNGIILNRRQWYTAVNDTALTVAIDCEHNGDGVTAASPNLWLTWMAGTSVYAVKLSWQGYRTGWSAPTSATTIKTGATSNRDCAGRWDGARFCMAVQNPSNNTQLIVMERNQSNTSTTTRTSPTHPTGNITSWAMAINHQTQDFRLYAAGTSTGVVYYVDYIRSTATWGSWTSANATAPQTAAWGVARSTAYSWQYNYLAQTGAGSPWTVANSINTVNFAPTAPTWVYGTAGGATVNGQAMDVSASLVLDWTHNDPNPTDAQASFALQRQIGAAAVQYWRTSDSTWQASEVQNSSASSVITLTTGQWLGAGGAADAAHIYKVKTWDGGGLPSVYSTGLSIIPSARVDPTLTHPTAAEVFNAARVTATWTVTEQSAYRVTVTQTAGSVLMHDSGYLRDPGGASPSILSYTVPVDLPDGFAGTLTLQTKNVEGLVSVTRSNTFTIDFVEPVNPIVTAVVDAGLTAGGMNVTVAQAAATGTQPVTTAVDLWRRKVTSNAAVNANPHFETAVTDWTGTGGTFVRDSTRAHSGTWSAKLTPTGGIAESYGITTGYAVTPGVTYEGRSWVWLTTANKPVKIALTWFDGSAVLISQSIRALTAVAGTWLFGSITDTAPVNAATVKLQVGLTGTAAATDTAWVDEATLLLGNTDLGIRVAAGLTLGAATLDWRAVGGVVYEYRAQAFAATTATNSYSPWVA